MLFSVRMRAAQGAAHEAGGRHISGAERLVHRDRITRTAQSMLERAFSHSRGQADFINITVEAVPEQAVRRIKLLPITTIEAGGVQAGRTAAKAALSAAGVSPLAADAGMERLLALKDSMRGAMLVCGQSGRRMDDTGERGVRVSRMDVDQNCCFTAWLAKQGLSGVHIREAVVLAAKVASAKGVIAELCWSDDPGYTAGYVASARGYIRFEQLKPYGSNLGGRIFFVEPEANITEMIYFLEKQPVLAVIPEEAG